MRLSSWVLAIVLCICSTAGAFAAQSQIGLKLGVQPWLPVMCESLQAHPKARFYKALAVFSQTFISVETQGFDMLA